MNNLSYSVCFENNNNNNSAILSRNTDFWVSDDQVTQCFSCRVKFGYFTRKHHCRGCGRIFCSDCSKYNINTAQVLSDKSLINRDLYIVECIKSKPQPNSYRSCINCSNIYKWIRDVARLFVIFRNSGLNIADYLSIRLVCKEWKYAADLYLSQLREIQYTLPTHELSSITKNILISNADYISGHNRLMVWLIKSLDWNRLTKSEADKYISLLQKAKTVNCRRLFCRRECSAVLNDFDWLEIVSQPVPRIIQELAVKHLSALSDDNIDCYLPFLVYFIRYNELLGNLLTNRAILSNVIRYGYYWELITQMEHNKGNKDIKKIYQNAFSYLEARLTKSQIQELVNSQYLINHLIKLRKYGTDYSDQVMNILLSSGKIDELKIPLNPSLKIKEILFDQVEVKNSSTSPIIITVKVDGPARFTTSSPPTMMEIKDSPIGIIDTTPRYQFMYKPADVRRDRIVMSIVKICDQLLRKSGLNLEILTYRVLPTGVNSGLIEIVPNSETIYNLIHSTSVHNFIQEYNDSIQVGDLRQRFINSMAAYSVITYLIGVGDRHLDNIMVTRDGYIFHIDFSYIMDSEPKPLPRPKIRITEEMVEVFGGVNSVHYQTFIQVCSNVYECLRRYDYIFLTLLLILSDLDNINYKQLEQKIKMRFLPGEQVHQADVQLIKMINDSRSASYTLTDFFHRQGKLIGKIIDLLSNIFK